MLLTAGECVWLDLTLIERVVKHSREMFPVVRYAFSSVPTYPSGTIGYIMASSNCVSCMCVCVCIIQWNLDTLGMSVLSIIRRLSLLLT